MINPGHDLTEKPGLDPLKWYEAIVVNNDDPRKLGRIRARIIGIQDGISNDALPWAIPDWDHADGSSNISGTFAVPKTNTKVWLRFQQGKPAFPMYCGFHEDLETRMEESLYHYPNRKVFRMQNKAMLVVDTEDNVAYIRNPGNVKIYIDGNVELEITGNVDELIRGNVRRHILGNVDEHIVGNYRRTIDGNHDEHLVGNHKEKIDGNHDEHLVGNYHRKIDGTFDEHVIGAHHELVIGSADRHVVGSYTNKIDGNYDEHVVGNEKHLVGGSEDRNVNGNFHQRVDGSIKESSGGNTQRYAGGTHYVESGSGLVFEAPRIDENSGVGAGDPGQAATAADAVNATDAVDATDAADHVFTEWPGIPGGPPGEGFSSLAAPEDISTMLMEGQTTPPTAEQAAAMKAAGLDPNVKNDNPVAAQTDTKQPNALVAVPQDCSEFEGQTTFSNSLQLSKYFTLAHLSTAAQLQRASVCAQCGLTAAQIVCNLKQHATNLLDPIAAKYGMPVVTSGFRPASQAGATSWHARGSATDLQWPGITDTEYYERACWIKDNLPFSEVILEYGGNRPWIHVAYNSTALSTTNFKTRVSVNNTYKTGLLLLKNAPGVGGVAIA